MYELIILSILMQRPAHGYLIAKAVNNVVGPFAKVNNGRLYPLLGKLQQEGWITPGETTGNEPETGRQVNTFQITETGRKAFRQIMLDTTSNPSEYQKFFWLKAPVLHFLERPERLRLIDHYLNYCQSHILYLTSKVEGYREREPDQPGPQNMKAALNSIEHRIKHWELELEWAKELRFLETESLAAEPEA